MAKNYAELAKAANDSAENIWQEIFEEENNLRSFLKFLWLAPVLLDRLSKFVYYTGKDIWNSGKNASHD